MAGGAQPTTAFQQPTGYGTPQLDIRDPSSGASSFELGGGRTTTTAPWLSQQPYLEAGFREAARMYNQGPPPGFSGPTLAGFDPSQQVSQRAKLGYALGPRPQALQAGAEASLMRGLSGAYDPNILDPMISRLGSQMQRNLQQDVLPGIRESMVQYQPGGGSRGDIVQGRAVADANQQWLDQAAALNLGAYQTAQQQVPQAWNAYQGIMNAPLSMYGAVGDVGADRRAMTQEAINRQQAAHQYSSNAQQQALQNYMATVSGDYGSRVQAPGPGIGDAVSAVLPSLLGFPKV